MRKLVVLALISIFLVSGCIDAPPEADDVSKSTMPRVACVEMCRQAILANMDLSIGPCLSEENPDDWQINDWVCDVVHIPKIPADRLSANQCQDYRKGISSHFVEVSPNCEFIRAV